MRPILFPKNATTFTTNGIGRLECISCEVVEERNGQYELTATIAETADHAGDIENDMIILAKPNNSSNLQQFRIYSITKPINGRFTVNAQHISYQLSYIPTMPFSVAADSTACNTVLQGLKSHAAEDCPFTFWTDVTTVAGYAQSAPASIRSRLGGSEGSVLDQFKGEFEWDGYTVKLHKNRGVTTPTVTLRYGKNITDLTQEKYINETITGVCPYWISAEGDQVVVLPEKVVESQYATAYAFKRTVTLDLSSDYENAPSQAELRAHAQAYLGKLGIGLPTVSIKVSFVALSDTVEYKDVAALQAVNLCDYIKVEFEKLGISENAKVVKTTYDVLKEKYSSIEVGTITPSLAQTISDTNGAIEVALAKANFAVKSATAWLTGSDGYVIAVKNTDGTWKELIFADHQEPENWVNVLRINENGIGFSHNGGASYSQAWTLDGKMIIGGTAAPSLTVYDSNNNVKFKIDNAGMIWNALNSSMDANGNLTMNGGSINLGWDSVNSRYNFSVTAGGVLTARSGIFNGKCQFYKENDASWLLTEINPDGQRGAIVFHGDTNESKTWTMAAIDAIGVRGFIVRIMDGSDFTYGIFRGGSDTTHTVKLNVNEQTPANLYVTGKLTVDGGVSLNGTCTVNGETITSDKRLKKGIHNLALKKAKDFIMSLMPKEFRYRKDDKYLHHGFIAQDVEEDNPWIIRDIDGEHMGIAYQSIIADLVAVVQDQEWRIAALEEAKNAKH